MMPMQFDNYGSHFSSRRRPVQNPGYVPPPPKLDAGEEREAITKELAALYRRMAALATDIGERPVVVEAEICRDAHNMIALEDAGVEKWNPMG